MKKINYLIFLFSSLCINSFAQGIIYKCTDSDGNVAYINEIKSNANCDKTNLAKVDKSTIVNKTNPTSVSNSGNPHVVNLGVADNIANDEQKLRDQKRAVILQSELTQEKTQLKTVLDMLSKLKSGDDEAQISQLKTMVDTHKRNVSSLEKELGVKVGVDLTPKIANKPSNLPFSLPKEMDVTDIQIVTVKPTINKQEKTYTSLIKQHPTIIAKISPTVTPVSLIEQKTEDLQYLSEGGLISNKSLKKKLEPILIK